MSDSLHLIPPRSAYLHIPFCHRRCFYCDFVVVPLGDKANGDSGPGSNSIKSYLNILHREISLFKIDIPLSTVYIGGGTPSLLNSSQLGSLLNHLEKNFGFQLGCEITLEIDPASFEENDLEEYLAIGINRISLGGQSFDDNDLEVMGRRHRCSDLIEACGWLNKAYMQNKMLSWSLDLIQNLPGQNLVSWKKQLKQALNFSPPHISIYDLSIESGTVFEGKEKKGELNLPNEDQALEMMTFSSEMLCKEGFSRYEISNFALPGHASRHNRVYWTGAGWWGFGQGATSSPWGERFARPRTREAYKDWVENQELKGIHYSLDKSNCRPMDLDEQIMTGLRTREGVDLEELAKRAGWSQRQCDDYLPLLLLRWKSLIDRGLMKCNGKRFQLSDPEGMQISNQFLVEMLLWWDSLPKDVVLSPKIEAPL